jgi:hypothetical protein
MPSGRKRLFITSGTHTGRFVNDAGMGAEALAAADAFCTQAAAPKGGQWFAWLSASPSAINHAPVDGGPWGQELADGGWVLTFPNQGSLATLPLSPITVDENGMPVGDVSVWTGTNVGGRGTSNCTSFSGTGEGMTGRAGASDRAWTEYGTFSCSSSLRLICLEQ